MITSCMMDDYEIGGLLEYRAITNEDNLNVGVCARGECCVYRASNCTTKKTQ